MLEMEAKHQAELAGLRSEKERLQRLVSRQSGTIEDLEKSLLAASANSSLLQRQQLQLLEAVQGLVRLVSQGRGERGEAAGQGVLRTLRWQLPSSRGGDFAPKMKNPEGSSALCPHGKGRHPPRGAHQCLCPAGANAPTGANASPLPPALLPRDEQLFQDCAELRQAGFHTSGVYTLHIANLSEPKKVSAPRGGLPLQHPGVLLSPGATRRARTPHQWRHPCCTSTNPEDGRSPREPP